jgi:hypothetical protein
MKTKKIAALLVCSTLFPTAIFACQVPVDSNEAIEQAMFKAYTFLAVALICFIATVIFYSLKRNIEGLIFIFVSGVTLLLAWADVNTSERDCGIGAVHSSQIAVAVTFVCFLAQFVTRLLFRKKSHAGLS